jgi:hypothetical protein
MKNKEDIIKIRFSLNLSPRHVAFENLYRELQAIAADSPGNAAKIAEEQRMHVVRVLLTHSNRSLFQPAAPIPAPTVSAPNPLHTQASNEYSGATQEANLQSLTSPMPLADGNPDVTPVGGLVMEDGSLKFGDLIIRSRKKSEKGVE